MSREVIEAEAKRVAEEFEKYLPSSYIRLLRKIRKSLERAARENHRRMLVVAGSDPAELGVAVGRALQYLGLVFRKVQGEQPRVLYVYHDEFVEAKLMKEIVKQMAKASKRKRVSVQVARYEESERYLGTTFDGLVLDLTRDLKPNDVGRLVGIVRGGGFIILVAPNWYSWDEARTLFKLGLTVPRHPEPRHIFISWFKRKLQEHPGIFIYDMDEKRIVKAQDYEAKETSKRKVEPPKKSLFPRELYKLALTQDQVNAIRLLENLVEKPRGKRFAVVLTADRGRGKSCAVGIGLVGLISELRKVKHRVRVLVTAPSPSSVQSLMELAMKAAETLDLKVKPVKRGGRIIELQGDRFSIEYWEPYVVSKLSADIVAVDEAAGIPIPMLHALWRKHRRIIFATTIHGYEGAGRGFSVRFMTALREDPKTRLYQYEMEEPIRYAKDDPIERWQFDTLMLDAEPAELGEEDIEAIKEGRLEYLKLDPGWLFSPEGEETLRQLFGIYVLAHYRNQPDDLGMLADAPHHSIRALRTPSGAIVCAVQLAEEGGLDGETIDDLLRGGRIPGNIIPDRFLKHLRMREFGSKVGWRIVRIATHPRVQSMGIGSRMLEEVYREAKERGYDWVGSGFGVSEKLLRFWVRNGYLPLHMSPDRNPVSGEYTVLVLKPISKPVARMVKIAYREFRLKLINSLHDTYNDLETEVALQILRADNPVFPDYRPVLTPVQVDRLWVYIYGPMTYEAACDAVYELARAYWLSYPKGVPELDEEAEHILVAKVLQAKPWEDVAAELKIHQYDVMRGLKEIVKKMAKHYYGLEFDKKPGISYRKAGYKGFNSLLGG